jgi:hypothetical protein
MAQLFGAFYWSKADYDAIMAKLDQVLFNQTKPSKSEEKIMSALDDLKAQVEMNTNLEQSGIQLIQGIARQLEEANNSGDNAAIQVLTQQLQSSAAALSAAIAANTEVTPVT